MDDCEQMQEIIDAIDKIMNSYRFISEKYLKAYTNAKEKLDEVLSDLESI